VAGGYLPKGRRLLRTARLRQRTPRAKRAADRRVKGARDFSREDDALPRALHSRVGDGNCGEESPRVRVKGIPVELVARRHLYEVAEVHHADAIGEVADHGEVVGDEEVGKAALLLEAVEEVYDLGLDRDVQSRNGLVGDDEARFYGEGASDANPLPLSTGKFVGKAVRMLARETHSLEQRVNALAALRRGFGKPVDVDAFGDDVQHHHPRVQRSVRILKDHLCLASIAKETPPTQDEDISAVEEDLSRRTVVKAQDRPPHRRFPAPRLPDEAKGFPLVNRKAYIVYRPKYLSASEVEVLAQVLYFE